MNNEEQLVSKFYKAFQKRDWKTMQSCYHQEATFNDPVFGTLNSLQTKAMWHMLCESAKYFKLEFSQIIANEDKGSCHWEAWYTFSLTGKKVHNIIEAQFEFHDGLIIRHQDKFDFWRWSKMALGATGMLLGWTIFLHSKVSKTAQNNLVKFIHKHPEYSN